MDYKKIIRSRALRMKILRLLSFVPDKPMIKLQYYIKTGRKLDLKNPTRYTEKMQWLKLYDRTPEIVMCTDKYDVREFVINQGCADILNECYGVFENVQDINYEKFPDSFVLKDTLGSAGIQVLIVKDKKTANFTEIETTLKKWLSVKSDKKDDGREWAYQKGKPHRIIAEKYIDAFDKEGGLIDYKFLCFNGVPRYLYVIGDRKMGESAGLAIYDIDFKKTEYYRLDERRLMIDIPKPQNYEKMIEIAKKLSSKFKYTRVDLYNQNGNIIFGELSFFDGSGYMKFEPDKFDEILGKCMEI